jgi:hypothetical protein
MKNMKLDTNSRFFSRVSRSGVRGARRVLQGVRGVELGKLEWSSPKHTLIVILVIP